MDETRQEELYLQYRREQSAIEEELEAHERRAGKLRQAQEEHRRFCVEERMMLDTELERYGYPEEYRMLDDYFTQYSYRQEREFKQKEEGLQREKRELKARQRESEDAYRDALMRLEAGEEI